MKRGRAASMPEPGYERPQRLADDGLVVSVVGENGEEYGPFDFTEVQAPEELTRALVAGFVRATGQSGRWRSRSSTEAAAGLLRRFARDVSHANPDLQTIEQLTPEVWWVWRGEVQARVRWPGQINLIRALLQDVEGLPHTTRRAMNAPAPKPKRRSYDAYSRSEFKRIRAAAWQRVETATDRIGANVACLGRHAMGESSPQFRLRDRVYSVGEMLSILSETGQLPDLEGLTAPVGAEIREALGVGDEMSAVNALFPSGLEIYALMILFVCERGYNPSVLDCMTISGGRADDRDLDEPVHLVQLDKPRRGPSARHFSHAFAGQHGALWERAVLLTQPARETLQRLGTPTDLLFVARSQRGSLDLPAGLFRTDWSQAYTAGNTWNSLVRIEGDDGAPLRVNLRRLRLTEQVVNAHASQNSQSVSESVYRQPDPQSRADAQRVILQGQTDALEHALATVKMRMLSSGDLIAGRANPQALADSLGVNGDQVLLLLDGRLDTATGACLDFTSSPFAEEAGEPCPASFLACFGCGNAVATPGHLPRLVALHDAMINVASAVSELVWHSDYQMHFSRLRDLLTHCATDAEILQARAGVTVDELLMVERLLQRGLDQ